MSEHINSETVLYIYNQEVKRDFQVHKELIKDNRDALGTITVKLQTYDHQISSQNYTIMGILPHLNQRVMQLEMECAFLRSTQ